MPVASVLRDLSFMKPRSCVCKSHHISEQNVIGCARIACLCFFKMRAIWPSGAQIIRYYFRCLMIKVIPNKYGLLFLSFLRCKYVLDLNNII